MGKDLLLRTISMYQHYLFIDRSTILHTFFNPSHSCLSRSKRVDAVWVIWTNTASTADINLKINLIPTGQKPAGFFISFLNTELLIVLAKHKNGRQNCAVSLTIIKGFLCQKIRYQKILIFPCIIFIVFFSLLSGDIIVLASFRIFYITMHFCLYFCLQ